MNKKRRLFANSVTRKIFAIFLATTLAIPSFFSASIAASADVSGVSDADFVSSLTLGTSKVVFGGHIWDVAGKTTASGNPAGVAAPTSNALTLILSNDDTSKMGTTHFGSNNYYSTSALKALIDTKLPADSREKNVIQTRTLDDVAGEPVQNAFYWPLSLTEKNSLAEEAKVFAAGEGFWWLRTPSGSSNATLADSLGMETYTPVSATLPNMGVRPAFYLRLEDLLFATAATGTGAKATTAGSSLTAVQTASSAAPLKLTLTTNTLALEEVSAVWSDPYNAGSKDIILTYAGATAGKDLAVIVKDAAGALKYYGLLASNIAEAGSVHMTLPTGFVVSDSIYVFVEERASNAYSTDFASEAKLLSLNPIVVKDLDFGISQVGTSAPAAQNITIYNHTNANININSIMPGSGYNVLAGTSIIPASGQNTSWQLRPEAAFLTGRGVYNNPFTITYGGTQTAAAMAYWNVGGVQITDSETLPSGEYGTPYTKLLLASGEGTKTWTQTGGVSLESIGLALSSSGLITGTPTKSVINFEFTAIVRNNPAQSGTYIVSDEATFKITIQKRTPVATITPVNKVYDGNTTATFTATLSNLVFGDAIELRGINASYDDANVGTNKFVDMDVANAYLTGGHAEYYALPDDLPLILRANITARSFDEAEIVLEGNNTSYPYTGVEIRPAVVQLNVNGVVIPASDYSVTYQDNVATGTATVYVAAKTSNVTGSVQRTFQITNATAPQINDEDTMLVAWRGVLYSKQISLNYSAGRGVDWALAGGTLPAGITLDPDTGVLSGITSAPAGTMYEPRISATNRVVGGTDIATFNFFVYEPITLSAGEFPAGLIGQAYTRVVVPHTGGSGLSITWKIVDATKLPPGLTFNETLGTIAGTPTASGTYIFEVSATEFPGESYEFKTSHFFSISIYDSLAIVSQTQLPTAVLGADYEKILEYAGHSDLDVTWSAVGLPSWLTLDAKTGRLSGKPTLATTQGNPYTFTITVQNKISSSSKVFTLDVYGKPQISGNAVLTTGYKGQDYYSAQLANYVSGGETRTPLDWSYSGNFPAGLTLNPKTGEISGVPTNNRVYEFDIIVSNAAGSSSQAFVIEIKGGLTIISSTSWIAVERKPLNDGEIAFVCKDQYGITRLCYWSLVGGSLPAGVTLSAAGMLTGAPAEMGNFTFTLKAESNGDDATQTFTLSVVDGSVRNDWATYNGKNYYQDEFGTPVHGWKYVPGPNGESAAWRYFMDDSGAAGQGWVDIERNGQTSRYYFWSKGDGTYATGYVRGLTGLDGIKNQNYLFDSSGKMQTGWKLVGGKWRYFDDETGATAVCWKTIVRANGTYTYYFWSNGEGTYAKNASYWLTGPDGEPGLFRFDGAGHLIN